MDTGLHCSCAEARLLPAAPRPSPAPTGSRTQPSGRLHCLEPTGVADQTCKEGGMANGTGSCWAFGGSVLSLELPFTLSPDSDPCGLGLRAVVTSAV